MFLSVKVGGVATDTFLYVLLVVEHMINWFFIIRIIIEKRNIDKNCDTGKIERLKNDLIGLVLGESLEIIIPAVYTICFVVAYYGPNADILGNIKNGYFHYTKIDDLRKPIENLLLLVTVDVLLLIVAFTLILKMAKINLFHVFVHLMKHYGLTFSIQIAFILEHLFCIIAIGCAFDFSFKFEWITNREEWLHNNTMHG